MNTSHLSLFLMAGSLCVTTPANAQYVLRGDDGAAQRVSVVDGALRNHGIVEIANARTLPPAGTPTPGVTNEVRIVVQQGQSMPVGETGTLDPGSNVNPTTMDAMGRIAFYSEVLGSPRNQGIFVSDGKQVQVIAMGCGARGGDGSTGTCGDPSPIGGTFSGMFLGTAFVPSMNDNGDVLFFSDVAGGSASRGLFLHRAASDDIVKVAAVGDASPLGGTLSAIGPGAMNNGRTVVFLASTGGNGSQGSDVLMWREGVVSKVAAVGDPAPGGELFMHIGTWSGGYSDGTFIPDAPAPAINDLGQIAFSAITPSARGYLTSQDGVHSWLVRAGDPAPGGGVFADFSGAAPLLNTRGDAAFLAYVVDETLGPEWFGAWFAGTPGNYRRALAHFDRLLDGDVYGMAWSRNPFRPLDDQGRLALWTSRKLADESFRESVLLSHSDGKLEVFVQQAEAVPSGGTYAEFSPWPTSNDASQIQFGAYVFGNPLFTDAQFIAKVIGDAVFRDGFEAGEIERRSWSASANQ